MTKQEVIDFINSQLQAPVTLVSKVINSLLKVLDFASQTAVDDVIPDWTNAIIFQTDGSDGGKYCLHPDTNGKKRIFETKIDDNLNNEPPTDPNVTENASWVEISQSAGSGITEWEAGVYGSGLVIVYHNHSVLGRGLYMLVNPSRPYASTDIEAEISAGDWENIITDTVDSQIKTATVDISSAQILALFDTPVDLIPAPGAGKMIRLISITLKYYFVTAAYSQGGNNMAIDYSSGTIVSSGNLLNILEYGTDRIAHLAPPGQGSTASVFENASIRLKHLGANPTLGDGTLRFSIQYQIVDFN